MGLIPGPKLIERDERLRYDTPKYYKRQSGCVHVY